MTHLDTELRQLKTDTVEMWNLVISQMTKAKESVEKYDQQLANEIHINEKRVDAFELKLNMDCEHILALFNPVAVDLRFVLAVLKINYNLERIGDYANGISHIIMDAKAPFSDELIKATKVLELFDTGNSMISEALESFEKEDKHIVNEIFLKDKKLDEVNSQANSIVADCIRKNPNCVDQSLQLLSIIRKLERVGDQTLNIAEEIIFFIEAKVLKHSKLQKEKEKEQKLNGK
jgi:phosphate transport system protein